MRRPPAWTSARTGSASIPRPTTTRRGPSWTRSSPAIRACSRTWRPIWPSASARSSAGRASPSSCGSSAPTSRSCGAKAQEVKKMLGGIDGVDEVNVELQTVIPQAEVDVDLEKAKKYGIKPGDVRRAAATIMSGEEVGDIFRDGKTYDVQVWSVPEARDSVEDISNILVDTPSGTPVRLGDVATVTIRPTANFIKHEQGRAPSGRRRRGAGAGSRCGVARRQGGPEVDRVPARAPGRGDRRLRRAGGSVPSALQLRARRPGRDHRPADGGVQELAGRGAPPGHPAHRPGRRPAGGLHDQQHAVDRLAGRLLHRARHHRPQRHHADQPLPAPGAEGGRARSVPSWPSRAPRSGSPPSS